MIKEIIATIKAEVRQSELVRKAEQQQEMRDKLTLDEALKMFSNGMDIVLNDGHVVNIVCRGTN